MIPPGRHIILCCDCEGTRDELSRMADAIDAAGVVANYFFVGDTVRAFPDVVRSIADRHQVESHTMTHPNLRTLSKSAQRREIMDGKAAVEDCIGRRTRGFRAPYHCLNRDTVEILNEEGFTFDASGLYFRYRMGAVQELTPSWFREWMPLYDWLRLSPETGWGVFRQIVRLRQVSLLPAHPQYSGRDAELVRGFGGFLRWAKNDAGARFWTIDEWLCETRGVALPP